MVVSGMYRPVVPVPEERWFVVRCESGLWV